MGTLDGSLNHLLGDSETHQLTGMAIYNPIEKVYIFDLTKLYFFVIEFW